MILTARTDPETLMKAIGKDMMDLLLSQGRAAVREVVTEANKYRVSADDLPYVFWVLASQHELPDMGPRQRVYNLMLDIMSRTGAMPNYQRAFKVAEDPATDEAADKVAVHLSYWAAKQMAPALLVGYSKILSKYQNAVPEATGGQVSAVVGVDYLDSTFRQILTLRSSWFADGELLRRVVRFLPE